MSSACRIAIACLFVAVCAVILSGGLTVAAFTVAGYLQSERLKVPSAGIIAFIILVILFFMLGLAPLFEWWFKLWRNVDRWVQSRFSLENEGR